MKQNSFAFLLPALCIIALLSGCIKNNIPYPRIQANFISLEARGQSGITQIDTVNRVATINFPEDTDIYSVQITGYSLTPGSHIVDNPFAARSTFRRRSTYILNSTRAICGASKAHKTLSATSK